MNLLRKAFHYVFGRSVICAILVVMLVAAIVLICFPLFFAWICYEAYKAYRAPAMNDVPYQMTLIHQLALEETQADTFADDAQAYAQFKEWLRQYDSTVHYTLPETVRLFRVWRNYTPEYPVEYSRQEEEEQA